MKEDPELRDCRMWRDQESTVDIVVDEVDEDENEETWTESADGEPEWEDENDSVSGQGPGSVSVSRYGGSFVADVEDSSESDSGEEEGALDREEMDYGMHIPPPPPPSYDPPNEEENDDANTADDPSIRAACGDPPAGPSGDDPSAVQASDWLDEEESPAVALPEPVHSSSTSDGEGETWEDEADGDNLSESWRIPDVSMSEIAAKRNSSRLP